MLVGFSYSLRSDGAPGSYNEELARLMANDYDILVANQIPVWVALQWEIADALEVIAPSVVPQESHVAAPLDLKPGDFLQPETIAELLTRRPTRGVEILWERVRHEQISQGHEPDPDLTATQFAACFNRIIRDRVFYTSFYEQEDGTGVTRVELHDLYRARLGSVGVEKRRLPDSAGPLGRYHARRVNRLILEAVLTSDKPIIQEMKYLSTQDGINQYLNQFAVEYPGRESRPPTHVVIYGHPEHRGRCRRQFLAAAFAAGWEFDPKRVLQGGSGATIGQHARNILLGSWTAPLWDGTTAQLWCRSKRNWEDYEAMGTLRLH